MAERTSALAIVGIGNLMRRDDGVGLAAVGSLERSDLRDAAGGHIDLLTADGEPTRLIDAWRDRGKAIVIDAVQSGAVPGSIHRIEVGVDPLPAWAVGSSSHSAGLAEAVVLARTLDRLPDQLIVFGMEAADVSLGEGLSDEVSDALPSLLRHVMAEARR